jgi:hypothetical protein
VERLERLALAQIALAPYVEKGHKLPTVDSARAEFDRWLGERPANVGTDDTAELRELLGLRGR